jgi:hypothetical protein
MILYRNCATQNSITDKIHALYMQHLPLTETIPSLSPYYLHASEQSVARVALEVAWWSLAFCPGTRERIYCV